MTTPVISPVGTIITTTKQISDADVALFTLVTTDQPPASEEPATPKEPAVAAEPQSVAVPNALVAALLAATAARHAGGLSAAILTRAEIVCLAAAHTDDTLTATAEVLAVDASAQTLRVRAACANQAGARLAEGTFELRANG